MSQTMLGISRLGYSSWRLVAGSVCDVLQYGICRRYYVTSEWRAALTAQVSRSMISCTNACLTCTLLAGTDRIQSNSYTNTHVT